MLHKVTQYQHKKKSREIFAARILLFGKKFESIYVRTHISGAFGMYLEARKRMISKTHNTINLIYCQSQEFNSKESRGRKSFTKGRVGNTDIFVFLKKCENSPSHKNEN